MTDRAFVSGRSTSITFGHMTSSIIDEFSRECLGEDNAQFDGCDRRPDELFQRLRCSNLHTAQTMRSLALKARCRDELLNGEIYVRRIVNRQWRQHSLRNHSIRTNNRSRKDSFNIGKVIVACNFKSDQTLGLAIALVQCWPCPTSAYTGGIALLLSLPACIVSLPPLIARYLL